MTDVTLARYSPQQSKTAAARAISAENLGPRAHSLLAVYRCVGWPIAARRDRPELPRLLRSGPNQLYRAVSQAPHDSTQRCLREGRNITTIATPPPRIDARSSHAARFLSACAGKPVERGPYRPAAPQGPDDQHHLFPPALKRPPVRFLWSTNSRLKLIKAACRVQVDRGYVRSAARTADSGRCWARSRG